MGSDEALIRGIRPQTELIGMWNGAARKRGLIQAYIWGHSPSYNTAFTKLVKMNVVRTLRECLNEIGMSRHTPGSR